MMEGKVPIGSSANRNPFQPSRGPLAAILPLFPCRFQLPILLGLNSCYLPEFYRNSMEFGD